jgi:hypothetical protein
MLLESSPTTCFTYLNNDKIRNLDVIPTPLNPTPSGRENAAAKLLLLWRQHHMLLPTCFTYLNND